MLQSVFLNIMIYTCIYKDFDIQYIILFISSAWAWYGPAISRATQT